MNEEKKPEAKPELLSKNVLILLLGVCLAAIAVVIFLVMRPGDREPEKVITLIKAAAPEEVGVNVLQVEDAIADSTIQAMEGHRYKVLIVDNAREGASGIARIGGLVTFVPDTKKGDVAIIEVTQLKRSTANANLIEVVESSVAVPDRPSDRPRRESRPGRDSGMVGQTYRGTVEDMGKEGDGIIKVNNKVVFIPDVEVGEHVEFEVIKDAGRVAFGEVVSKSDTPYPDEAPKAAVRSANQGKVDKYGAPPVSAGEEYDVTVTEQDRNNPNVDGVARIEKFVVFVPDTQPGDHVRIRITELRKRSANAEVIEKLDAETAAP